MATILRVAAAQLNSHDDVARNLAVVERLAGEARRQGAELLLLPENFAFMGGSDEQRRAVAEAIDGDGPILTSLRRLAREHDLTILGGGFPERTADPDRPHNTAVVVGADGQVQAVYRKIHLFDVEVGDGQTYRESAAVTPGESPVVVDIAGVKVGLSICYDLRFPELYRRLVELGAQVLVVPAAFTLVTGKDHWHVLLRARAIESQCYVVAAAQWGTHPKGRSTFGKSLVVDPWGDVIAQASEGVGLVSATVDLERLQRVRASLPCLNHRRLGILAINPRAKGSHPPCSKNCDFSYGGGGAGLLWAPGRPKLKPCMSSRQTPRSQDTLLADSDASSSLFTSSSPSSPVSSSGASSAPIVLAGRYELLALVGVGGMGTVYRARDRELDDEVALKVLRPEVVSTPGMLDRFRRELKLARRVTHRNVARSHDIGEDKDQRFLTMEFIDGEPLAQQLLRRQSFSSKRIIEIARAVCQGLAAAHERGVIHCDLKPENILMGSDGRIVITDFGIARGVFDAGLRNTLGAVLGTPAYMSPEQVEGSRDLSPTADLYALGVMLFELFTGELPWSGDSVFAVAVARLRQDPPDPRHLRSDLPEELARLILRCMARRPADRPQNAEEVDRLLAALRLDDLQTGPLPSLRATRLSPALAPEPVGKAIAVLPFRNAGAPDDAYLVDGLVEDLIDQLSMTPGLRVRPRGAVMHLASPDRDARELGRELDVQVVVEGSLRRAGDKLRLNARLISVSDGFQLWAKRFDSSAADVLSLSDELAQAISQALTVACGASPARVAPTNPRALDAYFRGRFEYHKYNPEDLARAITFLEEAKRLAPNDPMILSGYALACTRHWFFGIAGRDEQAREAAERALQLAPQRAEPLVALASIYFLSGDVIEAARYLRRALQIHKDLPDAQDLLGKMLLESGPVHRAREHLARAVELDPAFRSNATTVYRTLALRGRAEEAFESLEREMLDPNQGTGVWVTFARIVLWTNDRERAARYQKHPQILKTAFCKELLNFVLSPQQETQQRFLADSVFASLRATRRGSALFHQGSAEFAMILGHHEEALRCIDRAVQDGLFDVLWLDGCPLFEPIRSLPEFKEVQGRVHERAGQLRSVLGLS